MALTPEQISSLVTPTDARISPDGRRVAWTAAPWGKVGEHPDRGVWVADVGVPGSARRWTHGADDSAPRWSPDGSAIAFLSDRRERGTHGLYVLDVDGGEAREVVVTKSSVASFVWSPDGTTLAYLAPDEPTEDDERRTKERDDADVFGERWPHHRLWSIGLHGGPPQRAWAPPFHLLELAWSPDGERLALLARSAPPLETMATTQVWTHATGAADGVLVCAAPAASGLAWAGPGTVVFAAGQETEPQSSSTVWAVAAEPGATPRVVGTGADEPRCTDVHASSADGSVVIVVVLDGLDTRLERLDVATGTRTVTAEVRGDVESLTVTTTDDGPVVALTVSDDHLVAQVLAGPVDALVTVHDHAADRTDPTAPAAVEVCASEAFTATATDGVPLDAVLLRPAGVDADDTGPWPTAVIVHGGPYGRSGLTSHVHPLDWGQLLASRGYLVVLPNYRGSQGRGNAFAVAARGDMGGQEWADVLSIVDAVVDAGLADPDRLGIGGWSQGGFLTAWAVTATDRFKVGVMGAGVSDWSMMAATSDLPSFESALGGSTPWDGPGPHHASIGSPISYAARRTTPLLILHGADDARVPLTQATAFHHALSGQEAALELVVYPREPHGVREHRHQVDLQERVISWFDRHLRDGGGERT